MSRAARRLGEAVLTVKLERGILDEAPPPVDRASRPRRDHDGAKVAQAIANQGLTLVRPTRPHPLDGTPTW